MVDELNIRVLFVASFTKGEFSTLTLDQGESVKKFNVKLDYFGVRKGGISGYLNTIIPLRKAIRKGNYNIIHAHYLFSGIVASLATNKPVVVSLMGSDVEKSFLLRWLARIFHFISWKQIIVKSESLKNKLNIKAACVIPNGVDIEKFNFIPKNIASNKIGFSNNKRNILFLADPKRKEKNFSLAEKAVRLLDRQDVLLQTIFNKPSSEMPYYLNASDVILLTSLWEGSPNVIKEAMACNRPIVACNVGDIEDITGNIEGCFITTHNTREVTNALQKALDFQGPTSGRQRIKELKLDSESVAEKLTGLYKKVLSPN